MVSPRFAAFAGELVLTRAAVPLVLDRARTGGRYFVIGPDSFRMETPGGIVFRYRRGEGVQYTQPDGASDDEVALYVNGSVHGAVAWLNGLAVLHASAVVHRGRVFAVSGPSGAGKSTLVAALAQRGFAVFCDDVLVVDRADPACVMAMPGHKQLKLWEDALALTGVMPGRRVMDGMDKFYVGARANAASVVPLQLDRLYLLAKADALGIVPLTGSAGFAGWRAAFYRPEYAAQVMTRGAHFAMVAALAAAVPVSKFARPRDVTAFDVAVDLFARHLRDS